MENEEQTKTRMGLAIFGSVEQKLDFSLFVNQLFKSFEDLFANHKNELTCRIDLPICRKDREKGEFVQASIAVELANSELINKFYTKFSNTYNIDLAKLKKDGVVRSYSFIAEVV